VNPETGELWTAVNERDNLGDDIPSDYLTRVIHGGFYGWPYAYDGGIDDRVSSRPDLASRTIRPDLSLGAHVAPLQFAFYQGTQFPPPYTNGVFLAEHGSWNRRRKSGYQVVFIPFRNGILFGGSMSFMTGFLTDSGAKEVYGRPVGVAVGQDGSLFVSDDANKCIWRVSYR
jgi:glucose/arabinose dehydrogenase